MTDHADSAGGSELAQLRQLLLRPEQQRLLLLEKQLGDKAGRAAELAKLLPGAFDQAAADETLGRALATPVRQSLHEAVRDDAQGLADVLFPVMGPGIRRAIAEALRDFVNSLNGAVSEAVSWQGLKWRLEALRSGRPYGEVALSHRMKFRVEQALLIHAESGLVISQAEHLEAVANDSDAFSAMLSAIQDFVSDSLRGDSNLSTLDMGQHTIWIVRGPKAHLACVISGVPDQGLREYLAGILAEVHGRFAVAMAEFSGDRSRLPGIDAYPERCLDPPNAIHEGPPEVRWPAKLLAIGLLAALMVWLLQPARLSYPEQVHGLFSQSPGLMLQHAHESPQGWHLQLLRDPLADDPQELLSKAGLSDQLADLRVHAFHSLHPKLLLPRIRQRMQLPDTVTATIEGETLVLSGRAERRWFERLSAQLWLPAGVQAINTDALLPIFDLAGLRREVPEGVRVEMERDGLQYAGVAPLDWLKGLQRWHRERSDEPLAKTQALVALEWQQLEARIEPLQGESVFFAEMAELAAGQEQKLSQFKQQLLQLLPDLRAVDLGLRIGLVAYSDGIDTLERNQLVRELRGARIANYLTEAPAVTTEVAHEPHPDYTLSNSPDYSKRRVEIRLELVPTGDARP